jgi:hypothetical protein
MWETVPQRGSNSAIDHAALRAHSSAGSAKCPESKRFGGGGAGFDSRRLHHFYLETDTDEPNCRLRESRRRGFSEFGSRDGLAGGGHQPNGKIWRPPNPVGLEEQVMQSVDAGGVGSMMVLHDADDSTAIARNRARSRGRRLRVSALIALGTSLLILGRRSAPGSGQIAPQFERLATPLLGSVC